MKTNRTLAIVTAFVVVVLVLGANLGQFWTLQHTLGTEARLDAREWASGLVDSLPQIDHLIATGTVDSRQLAVLSDKLPKHGKIALSFYDSTGKLRFSAGVKPWVRSSNWSERSKAAAQKAVLTRTAQTTVFGSPWLSSEIYLFGGAFIPLRDGTGEVYGVIGAFIDRSESAVAFTDAFVQLSLVLSFVFTVALAGLSISYFFTRRQAKSSRQQVDYLAHFDQLTGLYNRGGFRTHLKKLKDSGNLSCDRAAVIYIDLDNFKTVNDTKGHSAGDAALRHVGESISECLGPHDIGVRFGGDEFVVICQADSSASAVSMAERIRAAIARPVKAEGATIALHASCGICTGAQCGADIESGLHHADLALYQAKLDGRDTYREYTPELESRIKRRLKIEEAVRSGLQNGLFELVYQPLMRANTRQCEGFEALLRLTGSDGEKLSPEEFIPVAEASGLIEQIGQWVLSTAVAEAATWPDHLSVAVNLSARQFDNGNLVAIVSQALSRSGLASHRLELEITESLLIQNADSVGRQLSALHALGVSIAMDDFGTGYSSLGYLWRYGFDKLKIDRSFVVGLGSDAARSKEIIDTIIVLAHRLDMSVTVEGIETETEAEVILGLDGDQVQGFLFGRPMPASDLPAFLLGNTTEMASPSGSKRLSTRNALVVG